MIDPLERWDATRRQARLRRAADVHRRCRTRRIAGRARRRRRRDRRRADRRSRLRPAGRPVRPARDPRRELPAGPAPRGRRSTRFAVLRVVDFGDAPVIPADPATTHAAIEQHGRPGRRGGRDPDRARRRPLDRRARHHRRRRQRTARSASSISTPTPTPAPRSSASRSRTGRRCTGSSRPGHVDPARYVQIGLRGYWPGEAEFVWQAERGITSFFMHDVRDRGIRRRDRAHRRARRRRAGVRLGRRRRARPGVRAGHRHARARRDDLRRPALGLPRAGAAGSISSAPTWSR